MRRGVFVALVVCGAQAALADEPRRAATPSASSGKADGAQASAPTYFDLAVSNGPGRGVTVYRFHRAEQKLTLLERLEGDAAGARTKTFNPLQTLGNAIIVLSPEGRKKPPPPPPPGDELRNRWKVPDAEVATAMQQLKAQVSNPGPVSIGQLQSAAAAPQAK
ncbi:hypothetical protein [Hyalangium gracile]|uniref:hypothetical protein n=1 Tax=Hyalangium gracile TaxID=394092 RepID=UPI001CCC9D0E|nr:hypothetical protein [Hyalangium gracile]